jgi:crotonobetaine/carnitine-CoA ligase
VPSGFEGYDDIKLCVVADGDAALDPLALLEFLGARLPHFMAPRYIECLAALPRTPTNKVRKRELRDAGVTPETWDRQRAGVKLKELYGARDAGRGSG